MPICITVNLSKPPDRRIKNDMGTNSLSTVFLRPVRKACGAFLWRVIRSLYLHFVLRVLYCHHIKNTGAHHENYNSQRHGQGIGKTRPYRAFYAA